MRRLLAASLLALAVASPALANSAEEPTFTPEGVRARIEFLADDLLEGRDAGTRGYDIAAHYVASEFERLGLKPAHAGDFYQKVPFVRRQADLAAGKVTIGGQSFPMGESAFLSIVVAGKQTVTAPVVFVGHGIVDPALRMDDYAGLDVAGKIVVILRGAPKSVPSDVAASLNNRKGEMAQAKGAIGMVTLATPALQKQFSPEAMRRELTRPQISWALADGTPFRTAPKLTVGGMMLDPVSRALFQGAPQSLDAIYKRADAGQAVKGFAIKQPITIQTDTAWTRFNSPNVVAMLPGSDPALANEYVLLMAHLDHNGVNEKAPGEDKIWNGAMDNAAGTATMLEVARAFAEGKTRPKRSILFAAVTAEEDGLLGSDYLARHPVTAGGKVVGVVNLDMPILLYDFKDVTAFGAEHSTMGPMVEAAAATQGVKVSADPLPEEGLFTRSDHYSFVKQGVPGVFLMTGFANGGEKAFRDFLATHYHQASDDVKLPFNWEAGAKFAAVNYAIARQVADAPEAPKWYVDSPFGKQFAPQAAKAARPAK